MGLNPERPPDPPHGGGRHRHHRPLPVRGTSRHRLRGAGIHLLNTDHRRTSRTRLVDQPVQAPLKEPSPPLTHRHPPAGQPRSWTPPRPPPVRSGTAAPAAQPDHQVRGPPAHRHVRQMLCHGPHRHALGPTGPAERVLLQGSQAALHQHLVRRYPPTRSNQSQAVQAQETSKIRGGEGSLRHVEVSVIGLVLTATNHRGPRPTPTTPTRVPTTTHHHTLKREERGIPPGAGFPNCLSTRRAWAHTGVSWSHPETATWRTLAGPIR